QGRLAGGLYGVRIGRFFAGESMFYAQRDASKVALMALVNLMRESGMTLLDVQWCTGPLASLGAVEGGRPRYLSLLAGAPGARGTRYNPASNRSPMGSLGPGARLGPYEILALIGSGGMGEVYRARDTRLDRAVAVKVLSALTAGDAGRLHRFAQE